MDMDVETVYKKQKYHKRFKISLIVDIVMAVEMFGLFSQFKDQYLFVITGVLICIDAFAMWKLLKYEGTPPKYFLYFNMGSNITSVILYLITKIVMFVDYDKYVGNGTTAMIISIVAFVLLFPLKLLKTYLLFKYKAFIKTEINDYSSVDTNNPDVDSDIEQ
eukprot:151361_1